MSRRHKSGVCCNQYAYKGPLGEVVYNAKYYFAWKDGQLIGTHKTLEEAMESLAWRDRLKQVITDDTSSLGRRES